MHGEKVSDMTVPNKIHVHVTSKRELTTNYNNSQGVM